MQGTGTWAEYLTELSGTAPADSSWWDRRTRLPRDIFAGLMRRVLRPRAQAAGAQVPALRVRLPTLLRVLRAMWLTMHPGEGILIGRQTQQMRRLGGAQMGRQLTPPR